MQTKYSTQTVVQLSSLSHLNNYLFYHFFFSYVKMRYFYMTSSNGHIHIYHMYLFDGILAIKSLSGTAFDYIRMRGTVLKSPSAVDSVVNISIYAHLRFNTSVFLTTPKFGYCLHPANSLIIALMRVGVKPWYLKRSKKKSAKIDWSNLTSSLWYIRRHWTYPVLNLFSWIMFSMSKVPLKSHYGTSCILDYGDDNSCYPEEEHTMVAKTWRNWPFYHQTKQS